MQSGPCPAREPGAGRTTPRATRAGGRRGRILGTVSTRMLIILSLLCGLALLVAFAIQANQIL